MSRINKENWVIANGTAINLYYVTHIDKEDLSIHFHFVQGEKQVLYFETKKDCKESYDAILECYIQIRSQEISYGKKSKRLCKD